MINTKNKLNHEWKNDLRHLFLLRAHRHQFSFCELSNDILVPALSNKLQHGSLPGFLELINYNNVILFKYHIIENNRINFNKTKD